MKNKLSYITFLVISFVLFCYLLLNIIYVPFTPRINTIVKTNYFLICLLISIVALFASFKFGLFRGWFTKVVSVILVMLLLIWIFVRSIFYSQFEQKVEKRLGKNIYLVSSYDPSLGICIKKYSIVKKQLVFLKEIYNIGCSAYKIDTIEKNRIRVIKIEQPLVKWHNTSSDTAILNL